MDPNLIYPTPGTSQLPEPPPMPAPKSSKRRIILIALATIVAVAVMTGAVVAINRKKTPVTTTVKTPAQTVVKLPTTPKTTVSSPASTTLSKPVSKQVTKPPQVKITQPSQSIQQTPQLPANTSSQPYVGSLPSTVPVYNTGPFNFYYVGGRQFANATGASASFSQAQPVVPEQPGAENHSLIEMAAESADGKQIVEVGWVVDSTMNGDALPHLFVYHWVDGSTSCYNGCGYVQVSSSIVPGQTVSVGAAASYGINYSGSNWNITYNGAVVGYFPGSLWSGTFTQFGFVAVFGEVAISTSSATQCVQMGNGLAGTNSSSTKISNFTLTNSNVGVALSPYATSPSSYSYGFASATGLNLGGPGAC